MSVEPHVAKSMRAFLRRLGFQSPSVKMCKSVSGEYVVTAYDPVDRYYFCRSYTIEEMECIIRANCLFWRFLK